MATTLAKGSIFAGYRIELVIGRGGMGVVYRATDLALSRPVALKVVAPELADDPGFRKRFLRESRLAAAIEHPHILPVHAAGEMDGILFLVMRFVEGEDLRARLEREGRLQPAAVIALLSQVAGALDAAHAKGLVHRDVKPGNVIVASSGEAYLCDFGLTKAVAGERGLTESGQFLGTVDYAAPEQIEGLDVDGRADQYALGCVLYECLAGDPPFAAASGMAALWAHMQEPPPSVHTTRPELPPAIDRVVGRALAKEAGQRYPTCAAFLEAARGALSVGVAPPPAEAPALPVAPPEPARANRRRLSRRAAIAMAIALAAAGAAAVVAVLLAGGGDEALVVVPNSLVRIDPETNEIAEVVPVGSWPDEVVAAGPYLFVTNIEDSTVSRLDTRSGVVRDFASVPHPRGLAAEDERTIWIGSNTEPEVARVDADTLAIERQILLEGLGAVWLAVGAGSLWVTHTPTGTASGFEPEPVSRVSLGSGQVEATFVTGLAPGQVAFGEGAAWVVNSGDSTVTRIDPGDGSLTQFGVGFTSYRVTTGLDAVWVPSEREAAVYRLSPATGRPRAIVPVGEIPWDVAASDDAVWATSHGSEGEAGGTLSRIDAETSRVVATIAVGQYPKGVAVTPDGVWVAVAGSAYPGRAGVPG